MNKAKVFDFAGYATKNDVPCSDGRVIRRDAFKHDNGRTVPLVWQHGINDPANILGHAVLENREDGVYARCFFNESENAKNAKSLVIHEAINCLSIRANQLGQVGKDVLSGVIKEVSLVLSGANPGAFIDTVSLAHGEYGDDEFAEVIIYSGKEITLAHSKNDSDILGNEEDTEDKEDKEDKDVKHQEKTVGDVLATLSDEQKAAVGYLIDEMTNDEGEDDTTHSKKEDNMKRNVFDKTVTGDADNAENTLTHADFLAIMDDAQRCMSFKSAFLAHAGDYGIDNIGLLFPDAQSVTQAPELYSRDMGWVSDVMNGTRHSPFSRIKTSYADITPDQARAKGYVTGNEKTEEVFALLGRTTTPTTIYKKQKLDRDDILDITDFDVVIWLKAEMRVLLDEEIARAVLVSDGRAVTDPDKIKVENIRPIAYDADMYAHKFIMDSTDPADIIDDVVRGHAFYKGTGSPAMFCTPQLLTDLLLEKDTLGRRLYNTTTELAAALRVSRIVEVPVMENITIDISAVTYDIHAIVVNLNDYTIGADKGGDINSFENFDIDFNQYKYLIETRCSGALTKCKSAIVFVAAHA